MRWLDSMLTILFPPACFGCRQPLAEARRLLCQSCQAVFAEPLQALCPQCGGRIPLDGRRLPARSRRCHPRAPYLLLALTRYNHPLVRRIIQQIKFERRSGLATQIGSQAARAIDAYVSQFDLVVPIPLAPGRLRERGFNQAERLARAVVAGQVNLNYYDGLTRIRSTRRQSDLSGRAERAANVAGCFAVKNPAALSGKRVVLIDDVATSGATLTEAARALASANVKSIVALVIARAR